MNQFHQVEAINVDVSNFHGLYMTQHYIVQTRLDWLSNWSIRNYLWKNFAQSYIYIYMCVCV